MNVLFRILNGKSNTVVYAAALLAVASFAADILGFLRDRLLAATFGAGDVLDSYYAAFRLPDLIFNFVALGILSAAFLPLYSEYAERKKEDGAAFAQSTVAALGTMLFLCACVAWLAAPLLMPLVAPGFAGPKLSQTIAATQLLLLSPVLFGISGVFSGILQHSRRFLLFALAPILYNTGIILGVIFLVPVFGLFGIVLGALMGACLHLVVQMPGVVQEGLFSQIRVLPLHPGVVKLVKLGLPRTAQLLSSQLTLVALVAIASSLASGSVAVLSLADNLQAVPIGVIGISFATAAFPRFAEAALGKDRERLSRMVTTTLSRVFFLVAPLAVLFFVLRAQIVRVALGAGAFSWEDTRLTAAALGMFAWGIAAQALVPTLIRAFFAAKDMVTPLLVTLVSAAVMVFSAAVAVSLLSGDLALGRGWLAALRVDDLDSAAVIGIPFGVALGSIVQVCLLLGALSAGARIQFSEFLRSFVRTSVSALGAGVAAFLTLRLVVPVLEPEDFLTTLSQGGIAGLAGLAVYFGIAKLLRFPELPALGEGIRRHFIPGTNGDEDI